jgi:phage terminase large subunit-like protein
MLKKLSIVCIVAIAALAAANTWTMEGGKGHGRAVNGTSSVDFSFGVAHFSDGTQSVHRGGLNLFQPPRMNQPATYITMRAVQSVEVDGNEVTFAGPGTMTVMTAAGPQQVQGTVMGWAKDNRTWQNPQGSADLVQFEFVPEGQSAAAFEFAGAILRGDVAVFVEQIP